MAPYFLSKRAHIRARTVSREMERVLSVTRRRCWLAFIPGWDIEIHRKVVPRDAFGILRLPLSDELRNVSYQYLFARVYLAFARLSRVASASDEYQNPTHPPSSPRFSPRRASNPREAR